MSVYRAVYIWIDGAEPTAKLRSKTKVIPIGEEPPLWGFDGSSTNQAPGENSDCVLRPVYSCPDPIRGGENRLVMCEVLLPDMSPHPSNTRAACAAAAEKYASFDTWFGIEQEYTFFDGIKPLGWPDNGFPAPQGGYYCGVGTDEVFGRPIVERPPGRLPRLRPHDLRHQRRGHARAVGVPDRAHGHTRDRRPALGRPLAPLPHRRGHPHLRHGEPRRHRPAGPQARPRRLERRRRAHQLLHVADARELRCLHRRRRALAANHDLHIANYGDRIEERLTGRHETASYKEFKYGVSDRGASVRIPWQVHRDQKGYIEDRRPNANCDPYVVTRLILESVCGAAS